MWNHRILVGSLLAVALLAGGSAARGQHLDHIVPPSGHGRLDLFAPPDLSAFGSGPEYNEGYFFNADFLQWHIEAPEPVIIGSSSLLDFPDSIVVTPALDVNGFPVVTPIGGLSTSTLDTVQFECPPDMKSGRRLEGGFVNDNHGLMLGFFRVRDRSEMTEGPGDQLLTPGLGNAFHGALVVFDDTTFGPGEPFGISYSEVHAINNLALSGVEVMGIHRFDRAREPYSGQFEWLYGVRYLNWDEKYNVSTIFGDAQALNSRSFWNTKGYNQLIGPQIGFRHYKQNRRWAWAAEGRFFAAANVQCVRQEVEHSDLTAQAVSFINGIVDATLDTVQPLASTSGFNATEFSPCGELRLEGSYTVTRRVRLRAGWTGMFVANLARPSQMVQYTWPSMGIIAENNREDVFINGVHLGVEVNH
jgi:hypothetical protein